MRPFQTSTLDPRTVRVVRLSLIASMLLYLMSAPSVACAQCSDPPCKGTYEITLKNNEGKDLVLSYQLLDSAVFGSDTILLLPGQTIYIEADATDVRPTHLHQVKKITHPKKTLVFNFVQTMNPRGDRVMQLTVTNPFPRLLGFHLGMMRPTDEEYGLTSSCPVMAHRSSIETWPEPIYKLSVTDMKFLTKAPGVCPTTHSR